MVKVPLGTTSRVDFGKLTNGAIVALYNQTEVRIPGKRIPLAVLISWLWHETVTVIAGAECDSGHVLQWQLWPELAHFQGK